MRMIAALLLLVLVTIFGLNNPSTVDVRFLAWQYSTSLALALLMAAVAGALVVFISSLLYQRTLHQEVRMQEQQIRRYEAMLRESGRPLYPAAAEREPLAPPPPPPASPLS